jgi:ParB-like chromosome segregation protein Spo0J
VTDTRSSQGARRFRAAQLAELTELPVRIVQLPDEQSLEWQIIELSVVVK